MKHEKCMVTPLDYNAWSSHVQADVRPIHKLQRNRCIRHSCTTTATCEARAALNKSEHRNAVHHLNTHHKNQYSEVTVKENPKCGLTRRC
ncbi:hypothetical protein EVAR_83531_1 [Eumeta japonica]|uniref:Uncharacterized protein n=1 Tax=Eumeta variegata TaxID=151549 RepID=A0A4C1ZDR3_EUMVA|nr:hypothetical protein EVAR_83531_1 [Eumeta japonica]